MKQILTILLCVLAAMPLRAGDHVMAATKPQSDSDRQVPASLSLTLAQAQDYAVAQNRSLRNASLAVQEAYAQRWQTIAAMLPQVDASTGYTSYCGYKATMSTAMGDMTISMPDYVSFGVTASVGVSGQGIVGAILNNIAIDMKQIALEQSEVDLRANVKTSYVSVLVLQNMVQLLDSSFTNFQ